MMSAKLCISNSWYKAQETMNLKQKGGHHHKTKDDYLAAFSWRDRAMEFIAVWNMDWGSGHVKRLTLHNKLLKNRPF
jgi:hypothetical protein